MLRAAIWPALLTIVLFAPCLGGGFVYDDMPMFVDTPWIAKATAASIFATDYWGMEGTHSWYYVHYRPLAILSFAAIQRAFGLSPFAYHAAGILMNAIATASFYWLLLGLRQRPSVVMGATLLFAVHPLHVEPVAWMIGLAETQTAAFMMASLACFAWGKRTASVLLAGAAIFTKESALILPAMVFAVEYLHTSNARKWLAALRAAIPYALIAAIYSGARALLLTAPPPGGVRAAMLKGLHILPAVAAANIKALFIPWPLSIQYELPGKPVIIGVLIAAVVFAFAVLRFSTLRADLLLSGALIVLPLIIPIVTAPLRSHWLLVQDRLEYVATAGACFLVASVLARLPGRALPLACLLLAPMGALGTYLQLGVWENEETLWTHVLEVTPTSSAASENLAGALYMDRRFAEAKKVLQQGLRYHPGDKDLNDFLDGMNRGRAVLRRAPPAS